MSGKLLPCPFCGGEAELLGERTFYVWCDKCETRGDYYNTEAEAIAAWNTRAERACKVVACYSPSDMNDEAEWYFAFSCGCELYWDEAKPPKFCPECGARVVSE